MSVVEKRMVVGDNLVIVTTKTIKRKELTAFRKFRIYHYLDHVPKSERNKEMIKCCNYFRITEEEFKEIQKDKKNNYWGPNN